MTGSSSSKGVTFDVPDPVLDYAYVMFEADKSLKKGDLHLTLDKAQRLEVYSGCMDVFKSLSKPSHGNTVLEQLRDERARLAVRMYWRNNLARFARQNTTQYKQGKTVVDELLESMMVVAE